MRRLARLLLVTLGPLVLLVAASACEREGPAERTGRNIDRGIDRMTR
jgi:hypothetical protein